MKHLTLIAIIASLFSISAFAEGQVSTECPWMKEMNKRVNTKANLLKEKEANQNKGSKAKSA